MTPAELFEVYVQRKIALPEYEEAAKQLDAIYQFNISGDQGGQWNVDLHDRQVHRGAAETADCTLSLSDEDLLRFIQGEISAPLLVLKRRLIIEGKLTLALKLKQLFRQHGRA